MPTEKDLPKGELLERKLSDLVCRSRRGDPQAAHALAVDHLKWAQSLVAGWGWRAGLRGADLEDALQKTFLWLLDAIRCYQPGRSDQTLSSGLRSLMRRAVYHDLLDHARHVRAEQRRRRSLVDANPDAGSPPHRRGRASKRLWLVEASSDPALQAERHELLAALEAALAQVDEPSRRLWEGRVALVRVRVLAEHLGLSPQQVNRRLARLERLLRKRLKRFCD
jgi:RNA polymerase sigma factor (sigma-70 family)